MPIFFQIIRSAYYGEKCTNTHKYVGDYVNGKALGQHPEILSQNIKEGYKAYGHHGGGSFHLPPDSCGNNHMVVVPCRHKS